MARAKKPNVVACQTPWCVALARPDGVYCSIHAERPTLRLLDGPWIAADSKTGDPNCSWCEGTGECHECEGEGECTCRCGDEHSCHSCDGTGRCESCSPRTRLRLSKPTEWAERYLTFAFDAGWQPWQPPPEALW